MDTTRFDRISQRFAHRRFTKNVTQEASPPAGIADDATESDGSPGADAPDKTYYLFVQSFQSGSIAPTAGAAGTYTVTLEQGLGQTVYFADRPSRDVGAVPTPDFLDTLGFANDNPPNAALVLETAPGETDIAVVELRNPTYDLETRTATYDVTVLQNSENSTQSGFTAASFDLAQTAPAFTAAHLFIDDCADGNVLCLDSGPGVNAEIQRHRYGNVPKCYSFPAGCIACEPAWGAYNASQETTDHWSFRCNNEVPACRKWNPQYGCYANDRY